MKKCIRLGAEATIVAAATGEKQSIKIDATTMAVENATQVAGINNVKNELKKVWTECQGFEIYTLAKKNWFDNCADNYTFYSDSFENIPFDEDGYVEVDYKYEVVGKEEYSHYSYDGWGWDDDDKVLIVVLEEI